MFFDFVMDLPAQTLTVESISGRQSSKKAFKSIVLARRSKNKSNELGRPTCQFVFLNVIGLPIDFLRVKCVLKDLLSIGSAKVDSLIHFLSIDFLSIGFVLSIHTDKL